MMGTQEKGYRKKAILELLTIVFYAIVIIFAAAEFQQNFIILFLFNPMFYAFSSGQRHPFATRIGDFFNDVDADYKLELGKQPSVMMSNHQRTVEVCVANENNTFIGVQNKNESSRFKKMFSFCSFTKTRKFRLVLEKICGSKLFADTLMLMFSALFIYFIDIHGWLIKQSTQLEAVNSSSSGNNDEIILYTSLFIVVSCMALDPSLLICRMLNYYETSLMFNNITTETNKNKHNGNGFRMKLKTFMKRICYFYDAPILTKSRHRNVFLDQVEHVFIGNERIIKTEDAPLTFERLRRAGCRFWLMSGKDEKSVMEIARYTGFLETSLKIKKIVFEEQQEGGIQAFLCDYEASGEESANKQTKVCNSTAIVLEAETFAKLESSRKCMNRAMKWISCCKAFIGCQLNAKQKEDILDGVRSCLSPEALTLGIGSSEEDLPMMKKAHISVKAYHEMDSDADYAVSEFRTLNRLLLLHGMSNQGRMFELRCFILFESAALRTAQFIWVLSSFVPHLMSSIEIFGSATIYYVNLLTIAWDVLFWIAAFLVYGPLYKYRGPNQKQRRPREFVTRVSHTRLYINASFKILTTFLGMALGTIIFSFAVKTFQVAHQTEINETNETLPIPDHNYITIDYLAGTNLMIVLCLVLLLETREWSCLCALIPVIAYAVYWFFRRLFVLQIFTFIIMNSGCVTSLSGILIILPNGQEQTSAASSLLKLYFGYWAYFKITFSKVWLPLAFGVVLVFVFLLFLALRNVFRQVRRKKYYSSNHSRRLIIGEIQTDYPSLLSNFQYFCRYKLYPQAYLLYSALRTFGYYTIHLVKIYFMCKLRTALCIIAVLQLMVFDNFWYMIGSIFGLTVPLLISIYDLIKKKCSPGRAVRISLNILNRKKRAWEERGSKHLKAGDIILLKNGDMVPADSILLSTSNKDACKYDQSFINGITKLNSCLAVTLTATLQTAEEFSSLELDIKLKDPWKQDASRFDAVITRKSVNDESVPQYESTMTSEINWLLSGYRIVASKWVVCLVAYDDLESKMNLDTKLDREFVEKMLVEEFQYLGRFLLGLFTFFLLLLLVYSFIRFSAGHVTGSNDLSDGNNASTTAKFLDNSAKTIFGLLDSKQLSVLSYLLGLVKLIPTPILAILSLIRLFETETEINRDKTMNSNSETNTKNLVSDESCFSKTMTTVLALAPQKWNNWLSNTLFLKVPTRVKTSSLNAFLGRVENVFIEKSGVLTKNHGNQYVTLKKCSVSGKTYYLNNHETNLPEELDEILVVIAISKEAYPLADVLKRSASTQLEIEEALTEEVAHFGYKVTSSGSGFGHPNSTYFVASNNEHKIAVDVRGKPRVYRFLYRIPAKVSCFIVRDLSALNENHQSERTLKNRIYAVGSLEEIRTLLHYDFVKQAEDEVDEWTKGGFTTLCIAWRDITLDDFKNFIKDVETNGSVKEKVVFEFLAGSLNLLGSVAYNDSRKMIHLLHTAKCRISVLTGDKLEDSDFASMLPSGYRVKHFYLENEDSSNYNNRAEETITSDRHTRVICLDGETWEKIFYDVDARKELEEELIDYNWFIGHKLKAYHKKEIIDLISKNVTPGKISMAIGNGVSDVPMLRRAHIGVVVRGEKPGEDVKTQADYVIGEFRFLKQLMHHGVLGKRNSFKLENILWYEMLMFNMMPFVWYTKAIIITGNQSSNLPFGESYTLPFLGAMAITYAIIVYWNRRAADKENVVSDSKFCEEYIESREQGRSNTIAYLVSLGVAQCVIVKLTTFLLFQTWKRSPKGEIRDNSSQTTDEEYYNALNMDLQTQGFLAFLSYLEVTYHTCIQSALIAYLLLQGKRRLITLLPLIGWFIYLVINSRTIRQQPLIPESLGFFSFFGRFALGLMLLAAFHCILLYGIKIVRSARKTGTTIQNVLFNDVRNMKKCVYSATTKVRKCLLELHQGRSASESGTLTA